jgi:hypothetical protein
MKKKDWLMMGALALGMMIWTPMPAGAGSLAPEEEETEEIEEEEEEEWEDDEEDEIPVPSKKETLAFLKKSMPLALELLEKIKEDEGDDEYEEVLEEMQERHFEYLEIRKHDGEKAAGLYLEGNRLELQLDQLLYRYHDVAETDEDREKLRAGIAEVLGAQLEHEKNAMKLELEMVRRHLREVEEELEEIEGLGKEEIEERLADLLEEDGEEDEDEGEDKGDDEEEDDE